MPICSHSLLVPFKKKKKEKLFGNFPGDPVVKIPLFNAG